MSEFVRIPVGTGTPEGVNSAFLLPERGVVIDPGPPTDEAWTTLRDGIDEAGITFDDIDHVLVTHWHVDHAGLTYRLGDRAEAAVHLHTDDAALVGNYAEARARRRARDRRTLTRWGVPESIRVAVLDRDTPAPLPDSFPVCEHDDGDVVAGVEFVHTPGHTKGHTSLSTESALFLGDVLLPTYTPNVGGSDTRLRDPLATYLSSLSRLEGRTETGEPGHGTTLGIPDAVDEVRRHHRRRAQNTFRAVSSADTASTPWMVARQLFGEMEGVHAKFGAGEAAAHLHRLADRGIVEILEGTPVRFRPVVDSYPPGVNLTP